MAISVTRPGKSIENPLSETSSERPRLALGAVEPERCVGIAENLFRGRVPADGLLQPVAEVGEVADGDGAAAELDVADRPLARAQAA